MDRDDAGSAAFALLNELPLPAWIIDANTYRFIAANHRVVEAYGYSLAELMSMTILDIRPASDIERTASFLEGAPNRDRHGLFRHMRKNGEVFDVEVFSRGIIFEGRKARIVAALDVTERTVAERRLRKTEDELRGVILQLATSEERYRALFEHVPAGIYRSTLDGRLIECNPAFAQILGYDSTAEIMLRSTRDLYFTSEDREESMRRLDSSKTLASYELLLRRKDGTGAWVLLSESLVHDSALGEMVMEGTMVDITERKAAEDLANHQAYHDALTNLPNRWLFRDRLSVAINRARRQNGGVSVLVIGIDHFKMVNDSAGYAAGDRLLQEVSTRLRMVLRSEDTIARQGGDEFLVALPDVREKDLGLMVSRMLDSLRGGFPIGDQELFLTGSIGAASYPADGDDAEALIRSAQSAMYRVKERGGDSYQFYTPTAQERVHERLRVESALRKALDREELVVHYQPQVDLRSGTVYGAEALVRWRRGDALIYPGDFIHIAEESGLIIPIGEWILRSVCEQGLAWKKAMPDLNFRLATNLSARQFADHGLVDRIERLIKDTGIDPSMLDLEITESLAMRDLALAQRVLHRLEDLGITISMDDFGTGYSSLNYLRLLPIHTVKIDRYFVADIHRRKDRSIIKAIIELAHSLEMKVLAEGVETTEQLDVLRDLDCDHMQGFLFSKAVPSSEFLGVARGPLAFLNRLGNA